MHEWKKIFCFQGLSLASWSPVSQLFCDNCSATNCLLLDTAFALACTSEVVCVPTGVACLVNVTLNHVLEKRTVKSVHWARAWFQNYTSHELLMAGAYDIAYILQTHDSVWKILPLKSSSSNKILGFSPVKSSKPHGNGVVTQSD